MFCSQCGAAVRDGEHFCANCGVALQSPGALTQQSAGQHAPARSKNTKESDPYKEQIQELRMQIRQLKLDLRQVNNKMSRTRSHYYQTRAFLPWRLKKGAKWFEDIRLLGNQPHKEQLQNQIADLQQQLLGLEQAQMEWKRERQYR